MFKTIWTNDMLFNLCVCECARCENTAFIVHRLTLHHTPQSGLGCAWSNMTNRNCLVSREAWPTSTYGHFVVVELDAHKRYYYFSNNIHIIIPNNDTFFLKLRKQHFTIGKYQDNLNFADVKLLIRQSINNNPKKCRGENVKFTTTSIL